MSAVSPPLSCLNSMNPQVNVFADRKEALFSATVFGPRDGVLVFDVAVDSDTGRQMMDRLG